MTDHRPVRAPVCGALLLFSLAAVAATPPAQAGGLCPASAYHDHGVVRHVFDGDTLELSDGRRVRLLGINTPELGHDDRPSEPFAGPAKTFLESLAPPGARLRLRLDAETHDRYGRLLAHVFLTDGANVQAELLTAGLAMTLVVPPNEWNHRCYDRLEDAARRESRGIWKLDRFRPVAAERLSGRFRGFRIVRGRVQRVGEGRKNLWLNLAPTVAIRIPKDDLTYFDTLPPRSLLRRRVEVRGYVERRRGELRITVRHPAAIEVID